MLPINMQSLKLFLSPILHLSVTWCCLLSARILPLLSYAARVHWRLLCVNVAQTAITQWKRKCDPVSFTRFSHLSAHSPSTPCDLCITFARQLIMSASLSFPSAYCLVCYVARGRAGQAKYTCSCRREIFRPWIGVCVAALRRSLPVYRESSAYFLLAIAVVVNVLWRRLGCIKAVRSLCGRKRKSGNNCIVISYR